MSDFPQSLAAWLEPLEKKQDPGHFRLIRQATDPKGREYVDHAAQMAHPPPHLTHHIGEYREQITNSNATVRPSKKTDLRGITRKLVYKGKAGQRFMIKPYHERLSSQTRAWTRFPIQGWAEMANQALYHAGGIGGLHQNVHIDEHNMGEGADAEPALVVHLAPGFHTVAAGHKDEDKRGPFRDALHHHDDMMHGARKIALMDFLTNNLDRHAGNLLWHPDGHILAIDHGRSFQYKTGTRWGQSLAERRGHQSDSIQNYTSSDAFRALAVAGPFQREGTQLGRRDVPRFNDSELWEPAFDWWGKASPAIREQMRRETQHLRSPELRMHLQRNFNARASLLDEMAKWGAGNYGHYTWNRHQIPIYRPDEKAEDE